MKENKYDDPAFFEQYSRFPRSVEGLSAAGEWHAFQRLLPDFSNKRVLDIGCGFGWHCIYAADNGARRVIGTDISEKMLSVARENTSSPVVEYQRVAMEDLDYPCASFDVVISSLAFHYAADFSQICSKVASFLSPGGVFTFSVEHPVFTAHGSQEWAVDAEGNRLFWPVDRYFQQGLRDTVFLGEKVVKYHRTLTAYISALLSNDFTITAVVEPEPDPDPRLLDSVAGMKDELRRPMMLIVSAIRN